MITWPQALILIVPLTALLAGAIAGLLVLGYCVGILVNRLDKHDETAKELRAGAGKLNEDIGAWNERLAVCEEKHIEAVRRLNAFDQRFASVHRMIANVQDGTAGNVQFLPFNTGKGRR